MEYIVFVISFYESTAYNFPVALQAGAWYYYAKLRLWPYCRCKTLAMGEKRTEAEPRLFLAETKK